MQKKTISDSYFIEVLVLLCFSTGFDPRGMNFAEMENSVIT